MAVESLTSVPKSIDLFANTSHFCWYWAFLRHISKHFVNFIRIAASLFFIENLSFYRKGTIELICYDYRRNFLAPGSKFLFSKWMDWEDNWREWKTVLYFIEISWNELFSHCCLKLGAILIFLSKFVLLFGGFLELQMNLSMYTKKLCFKPILAVSSR